MSELKALLPYENGRGTVKGWDVSTNTSIDIYDKQVYLKSEADKVIAEKDKEIAELKCQVNGLRNRSNLWHYNAVEEHKKFVQIELQMKELKKSCNDKDDWCLHTLKELRHHKYKRCLAMAKICEDKLGTVVKPGWWDKWHKRWLALAEQFKEAK